MCSGAIAHDRTRIQEETGSWQEAAQQLRPNLSGHFRTASELPHSNGQPWVLAFGSSRERLAWPCRRIRRAFACSRRAQPDSDVHWGGRMPSSERAAATAPPASTRIGAQPSCQLQLYIRIWNCTKCQASDRSGHKPSLRTQQKQPIIAIICTPKYQGVNSTMMRLKVAWSLLLLLLVSVQAFAAACDVRCGAIASADSASHMTGMAHCHGMASQPLPTQQSVVSLMSSQPCASHICKNDWTFLQNPVVHELGISPLSLAVLGHAVIPVKIARPLQFKPDRSTHSIPAYDPIISSLRV
jgi:hypothetical protein